MAVIPMEANRIVAHWFYALQFGYGAEDGQQLSLLELVRLSWSTVLHCA